MVGVGGMDPGPGAGVSGPRGSIEDVLNSSPVPVWLAGLPDKTILDASRQKIWDIDQSRRQRVLRMNKLAETPTCLELLNAAYVDPEDYG